MVDTSSPAARPRAAITGVDCKSDAYFAWRVERFLAGGFATRFFAGRFFAVRFVVVRLFVTRFPAGRFVELFRTSATRSGSALPPVDRFHSSYCSSVIFPSTRSCANFRR
jgi:hypothetical protein